MPFKFRLRRSKGKRASEQLHTDHGVSKGQGSLGAAGRDEQAAHTGDSALPNAAVMQPATAHGASPVVAVESRPSLLRRTLSSLSLRNTQKASTDSVAVGERPRGQGEGNRRGESASGGRQTENHVATEADHGRRAAAYHHLFPDLYGQPAAGIHDGSSEQGELTAHGPVHLRHLHLPHFLEGRPHNSGHRHDAFILTDHPDEVMKILHDATNHAKKIVEVAKGERETLLARARTEAVKEINALRLSLEKESYVFEEDDSLEETVRAATAREEKLTREILETPEEQLAASVSLCVYQVLKVNTSLAPDRRDALRHLKKNPPNFFRKSKAHCYPSVRNDEEKHHARGLQRFAASGSWDQDPRVPSPSDGGADKNATIYASILGNRTYMEEDELLIDFDELGSPRPVNRVSTVFHNACGCLLG